MKPPRELTSLELEHEAHFDRRYEEEDYPATPLAAGEGFMPIDHDNVVWAFPKAPIPIQVESGMRHKAADAAVIALMVTNADIYQRGLEMVRIVSSKAKASDGAVVTFPSIGKVTPPVLARELGTAATWTRQSKRKGSNTASPIDPPKEVVEQLFGMPDEWRLRTLKGVIATPTLRPDGTILRKQGYDGLTGLYLCKTVDMPNIPDAPTQVQARRALNILTDLLSEFPFVDAVSRSVALSMLMTPVLRPALDPAVPIHVVDAPSPGTGKSYLADLASMIALNERCPVLAVAPKEDETEKRLIGAAKAGRPIIALDNCNGVLSGDFLAQVSERPIMDLRPLGTSDLVKIPNTFTVFANGNNIIVRGDITRRTVRCVLDAKLENPTARTFDKNPIALIEANRGLYIAAILCIARAYIAAGYPGKPRALPSYEPWSNLICGALTWLGEANPADSQSALQTEDPAHSELIAVVNAWPFKQPVPTAVLIKRAEEDREAEWAEALSAVAPGKFSLIDTTKLGVWLRGNKNRVIGTKKLVREGSETRPLWGVRGV